MPGYAIWTAAAMTLCLAACGKKEAPVMPDPPSQATGGETQPEKTPAQVQAMLASLPAPYNTADAADGERQFGQCRSCHSVAKDGPNMTGPHLYAVVGRKAGSLADFDYSSGLKSSGMTWDAPTLDKWLTGPRAVVPDTKMSFLGIKDAQKRADVIAYLRTQADS